MKRTFILWLLAATCAVVVTSCRTIPPIEHYVYAPEPPQTPMFTKKGEWDVTASYSTGRVFDSDSTYRRGPQVQAAYALTRHLAVTASWTYRREMDKYDSVIYSSPAYVYYPVALSYKRSSWSVGLGYFTRLWKSPFYFDLYGGYGFGTYHMYEHGKLAAGTYDLSHSTQFYKLYLQPAIRFGSDPDVFQVALSVRGTLMTYRNINSDYTPAQEDWLHLASIRNTRYQFLETALTFRFGLRQLPWAKMIVQFSGSGRQNGDFIYCRQGNLTSGFSFDFSKIKKKKTTGSR